VQNASKSSKSGYEELLPLNKNLLFFEKLLFYFLQKIKFFLSLFFVFFGHFFFFGKDFTWFFTNQKKIKKKCPKKTTKSDQKKLNFLEKMKTIIFQKKVSSRLRGELFSIVQKKK
jgi:hypothetical protein